MKKTFKKFASLFLFALLLVSVVGSKGASARVINRPTSWNISLTQIATGVPYYSTYRAVNPSTPSYSSPYKLTSNCAVVQFKYTNSIANTWVWVDYNNVTDYKLLDFKNVGGYCYKTVAIPNLTPGSHQIQVRAASPDYMSSAIKFDSTNVTVPTTTSSAVTFN